MPLDGWVKLWRKSIATGLIKNHNVWVFWTYCIMKANHKTDYKQVIGYQEILLQPGQFIFGRKTASEETGLSEQKIRTCVSFLKKIKNITIKSTNKFSIITIINWDTYQNDCEKSTIKSTITQPTSNQQVTTNKNIRIKEDKEIYSRVISYLNKKTGKNFKDNTKATRTKIDARINEGASPEDFKTVIDNKVNDWKKEKFDFTYLRPETLFGTKFESYLNQSPINGVEETEEEILKKFGLGVEE